VALWCHIRIGAIPPSPRFKAGGWLFEFTCSFLMPRCGPGLGLRRGWLGALHPPALDVDGLIFDARNPTRVAGAAVAMVVR
jgi:hypothetical protein